MATETNTKNISGNSPDIYEGSYKDIFTYVNFKFSVFSSPRSKNAVGRPKYPDHALFGALVLKNLALNSSFRTIEAMLLQDQELAGLMGFDPTNPPSDSAMRRFFAELELKDIYAIHARLLWELRALGYAHGRIIAEDSTPLEAYCRAPTKTGMPAADPDARWGKAKCKNGWYFGYKAQVVVDAEDYLPLHAIATPANVSDQKMVKPFIKPLKDLGYQPERALLDAGYDSEANHFALREALGCISMICPNKRRSKKSFSKKLIKKYKKLLYQTTLDKYIPKAKRRKEYRKCALVLHTEREYKKYYWMRVASEQQFATWKKDLFLEVHSFMGLQNIQKHVALKCLCMLVIALAALRMGCPEAMRSPKFFQH
ncbi:MAG: transposase [Candidatus Helarchaeota archaeon]